MNLFYQDLSYTFFYLWTKKHYLNDFKINKSENITTFTKSVFQYTIIISFYSNQIIEEQILDKEERIHYYMHFEFIDLLQASRFVSDFMQCSKNLSHHKSKVLLCCSCGITSAFFAEQLQLHIYAGHLDIKIEAIDIYTLMQEMPNTELILLSPQVGHYYHSFSALFPNKVVKIPITDYAAYQYASILQLIINYLNQ